MNARTKHLSVFSESVKCKTRRGDLGKRERLMACGKWKGGCVIDRAGDKNKVRPFSFFLLRTVKGEGNWKV